MTEHEPPGLTSRGSVPSALGMLRAGCWLGLLLLVAKAVTPDAPWFPEFPRRVVTLLTSTWTDVLFALASGLLAELVLWLAARRRKMAAILRGLFLGFFAVCAAYAVAAVGVFRYFNRPLTYELIGLVGNATTIRSSVVERLTLPIGVALACAPLLFLALAIFVGGNRRTIRIAAGGLSLWCIMGMALRLKWQDDGPLTHLWLSPHVELIRTTAIRLAGGRRPSFPKDFPPEYRDEFRTFAARGAIAGSHFQVPDGVARPRNAILIVLESVGTKYLRLYGNAQEFTPTLTAEAQHALVFDNIYAHASFTYASFRPIIFSVYPGLPWHYSLLEGGRPWPLTLAAALQARGSRTAYITSGDLDWGDQRWLLERQSGFDVCEGAADLGCPPLSSWGTEDRCLVERLIEWIDEKPDQPFFAVCWTDQTHDPYLLGPGAAPAGSHKGKSEARFAADFSRYLKILRETDAQLSRIFAALRERGLADETLVVVTGDHGEAFADPHDQRGHAWTVYEEEVHVPLMIWNPRLFPQGRRAETIGGQVDLNPTMADVLEVEPPGNWQGHSLFASQRPARAYFMAIAGGDVFGVREGDWKYIYDVTTGQESLFHLASDPNEQRNLATREPERAKQLRQRVAAWVTFEDAFLQGREN
ncbi:MAG: sulfatase [Chthoniobacterales bacterium]